MQSEMLMLYKLMILYILDRIDFPMTDSQLTDFFIGKNWFFSWLHILLSIVLTLAVGYAIGAFYSGEVLGAVGYGYFSMNLNSYINPVSPHFSGDNNWSAFLSDRAYFGGQNEGVDCSPVTQRVGGQNCLYGKGKGSCNFFAGI